MPKIIRFPLPLKCVKSYWTFVNVNPDMKNLMSTLQNFIAVWKLISSSSKPDCYTVL